MLETRPWYAVGIDLKLAPTPFMPSSLLMLVAILYLVAQYKEQTGHYTFELSQLRLLLLPATAQFWYRNHTPGPGQIRHRNHLLPSSQP